jgi:RNA polymerase sigma factor (TIGR02999 family)
MNEPSPKHDVTELLRKWSLEGDRGSLDQLMPLVSRELQRMARSFFEQERSNHTLQPTALVNEVYLRLVDRKKATWESRAHFLSFAARTMRRILVEHARKRKAAKRGGGANPVTLQDSSLWEGQRGVELLALDEALSRLAELDPRQARVVELRYFAGLNTEEIASVIEMGTATVTRDLAMARAWLRRELEG